MFVVISNFSHIFHVFYLSGSDDYLRRGGVLYLIFLPFYLEQSRQPRLSLALLYNSLLFYLLLFLFIELRCVSIMLTRFL